jgi:putative nucleotidyltransferase with HDIG domain
MSWGKRKLRLYQDRPLPRSAATVRMVLRRPIARMRKGPTDVLPSGGTDGTAIVYPFWGSVKSRLGTGNAPLVVWWAAFLNLSAALTGVLLVVVGPTTPSWWKLAALAVVAGIAERQAVRVSSNVEMTVSFLPFVFTAVAFGPTAAFLVGAASNLAVLRPPYLRWAVYTPARALCGALTGLAATAFASTDHRGFGPIVFATAVAGVTNSALDTFFNTTTLATRRSAPASSFIRATGPLLVLSLPLYVPVVALMVYGYRNYSFWMAATFLVPAIALQRLVHLYQEQRETSDALAIANARLEQASLSFAAGLVATLDARDRYTAGHSAAVAVYARDIAERLGLSAHDQQLAHVAGLVHDIGKVGLPPGLLEKPGPLSLEERRQMEQHPEIGERILSKIDDYSEIARIVRHHHERIDGRGYPDGLAGSEIPLLSRIIAVADSYNAMTSARPYRDPMPSRVARLRMAQAVESQLDTSVVAAFEAVLTQASESYRTGTGFQFDFEQPAGELAQTEPAALAVVIATAS